MRVCTIIWNYTQIRNCSGFDCLFICSLEGLMLLFKTLHQRQGNTWNSAQSLRNNDMTSKREAVDSRGEDCGSLKYQTSTQTHGQDKTLVYKQPWITFMFFCSYLFEGWRGCKGVAIERVSIKDLHYAKVAFICFPVGMKCFYFRENCPEP